MMISSKVLPVALLCFSLLYLLQQAAGQFPSICNNPTSLNTKTCCPNDCSGTTRGRCVSIRNSAESQGNSANQTIITILANAPNATYKGTIDSRYLWPTMVFESVCVCNGNYYGADCSECAFGWTGDNCQTRKPLVVRKRYSSLPESEKQKVLNGLQLLKSEMGYWSVIVSEPRTTSGRVELQNVSTYDYLVYIHNFVARDASEACTSLNGDIVDFAHSGPNFPVWHRTYLLILEKAMQRVLRDKNFGFPYWDWENNDVSPFDTSYFGTRSKTKGTNQDVSGDHLTNWNTVCDIAYRHKNGAQTYFKETGESLCSVYWALCNPGDDTNENNRLQRGLEETYLPGVREIKMTIAAPEYDIADSEGKYQRQSPKGSFRSRFEGWSMICSASNCAGPPIISDYQRMHNIVHDWIGGHMAIPASAVNDPVFSLHHCNIDHILESWRQQFTTKPLPNYVPERNGHPGHNKNDFMVPFFPLITPGEQYDPNFLLGYQYDNLIPADISESDINPCPSYTKNNIQECVICHADTSCYCSHFENDNLKYTQCMSACPDGSTNLTRCMAVTPTNKPPSSSTGRPGGNQQLFLLITLIGIIATSA